MASAANLPDGEAGTGLANDERSLPLLRELEFGFPPASQGGRLSGEYDLRTVRDLRCLLELSMPAMGFEDNDAKIGERSQRLLNAWSDLVP